MIEREEGRAEPYRDEHLEGGLDAIEREVRRIADVVGRFVYPTPKASA